MLNAFSTRNKQNNDTTKSTETVMKSIISDHHMLSNTSWAVSLVRKRGTEHAYLIIEGKRSNDYIAFRTDLFLDSSQRDAVVQKMPKSMGNVIDQLWGFSESSSGTAFIKLKEINLTELEKSAQESEYQGWGISTEEVEKLLKRVIKEANKSSITYNKTGNHPSWSSSYSHSNYHNCVSWCEMILNEELNIDLGTRWELIHRPSEIVRKAIEQGEIRKQERSISDVSKK